MPIPEISLNHAEDLLKALRPTVADIAGITTIHYLAGGKAGISHFQALFNLIIKNVNVSTLKKLNAAWAIMLYKGGAKPRHLAKSWRCISTCPLLAKAMDLYVYRLHKNQCTM